ncbi:MAG: hypothetical protein P8X63_00910 [Desulfuromonadaceae bacterium]|jgi:hypothetical protein
MPLKLDFTFDDKNYRHFLNGHAVVMHSHHYLALITKLAEDFNDIGGSQILADTVEDTMLAMFLDYFQQNGIGTPEEKAEVCTDYYSTFGLGKMTITPQENGGEAGLSRSHLDEGWVMKWGQNQQPINHFTRGYVAAAFAAIFDRPARSFSVSETAAIVTGADQSVFVAQAS